MNSSAWVNIATHLPTMAAERPYQPAVIFPEGRDGSGRVSYTHLTFSQLNHETDLYTIGLEVIGIARGTRVVLMVKPGLEFFVLSFALFKLGAIPVLVDPGIGMRLLKVCLEEAEPHAFIGTEKAQIARILLGWGRLTIRTVVTVGKRHFWGGYTLDELRLLGRARNGASMAHTRSDDFAAILFTSGSTGIPKGVVYTHGIFWEQVEILRDLYNIQPGEIDLATFPLFALFAPALKMTAIVPDMDATKPARVVPWKIIEAIENFGVTNLFGSPALLNRVGRYGVAQGTKLPSLKRVISAGAPVPAAVLERFSNLLAPGVEIYTPFGATEALPVCSIGSREILEETRAKTADGAGVCVGKPVKNVRVEIIKISDDPIREWSNDLREVEGKVGEIVVQGPTVTKTYWKRADSTAAAKILDPENDSFFHRMGDLGYRDEDGRVWFCGRKSQRIVTDSGTLFTIPCEGVFNSHPRVFRTALVKVAQNGSARPVLCVELEKETCLSETESIKRELLILGSRFSHTKVIQTILFHPSFPVDIRHNSKIFREKLALWAARHLS